MSTSTATERAGPLACCLHVSHTYGHGSSATVAVTDTSCEIRPGELIALTGPSGSGKTTLLYLLAGLDRPTGGTVSWPALGGIEDLRPGPIAMVFQGPSLLPPLTVLENVALPLQLLGSPEPQALAAAAAALERLGIGELVAKLPEEISGGQAQRAAVARVLVSRPRLILADEPTGQLDHENGLLAVGVLIETARETGAALVVSTHDPEIAASLPEQWQMADGRLSVREEAACSS
ncbi:MAG: ABC transporter ATP-binding protein [Thermoleophilia bacterium]|nr:ABC transporter ATP-binding protein [Thermoleophilia bacterium]